MMQFTDNPCLFYMLSAFINNTLPSAAFLIRYGAYSKSSNIHASEQFQQFHLLTRFTFIFCKLSCVEAPKVICPIKRQQLFLFSASKKVTTPPTSPEISIGKTIQDFDTLHRHFPQPPCPTARQFAHIFPASPRNPCLFHI